MREQPDLFGEIHEDEIVKIAWEVAPERGYVIYADFNEYMGQKMTKGQLKPVRGGWFHHTIKRALVQGGWKWIPRTPSYGRPETQFYPPSTGPPLWLQHQLNMKPLRAPEPRKGG